MSMFISNEAATDWLSKPVSGIDGLGSLVYNDVEQRYEVPGVGAIDIPDVSANMAKGVARNVLATYCSTADISSVTDAEISKLAVDVVHGMTAAEILQIADTKSSPYQWYAKELGRRVCNLATSRMQGSKMPIPWGWIALLGAAVIGGYFLFKGK